MDELLTMPYDGSVNNNNNNNNPTFIVEDTELPTSSAVYLSPTAMNSLKIWFGAVVLVEGKQERKTACTVLREESGNWGDDKIRMNKLVRKQLRVSLGDRVSLNILGKIQKGNKITLRPIRDQEDESEFIWENLFEAYLRPYFFQAYRPLNEGDVFEVTGVARSIKFQVVEAQPSSFCIVGPATIIECESGKITTKRKADGQKATKKRKLTSQDSANETRMVNMTEAVPIGNKSMNEQIPDPVIDNPLAEDEGKTETDSNLPDEVLEGPQSEPETIPGRTLSTKHNFETIEVPVCEGCDGALFSSSPPRFVRSDLLRPLDQNVLEEMDKKDMHFFHHLDIIGSAKKDIECDGVSRIRMHEDMWWSGCHHYYHNACLLGIIQDTILAKLNKAGISPSSIRFRCTAEHCDEYFGFPQALLTFRMQPCRMKEFKICKDYDDHAQLSELIENERKLKLQVAEQEEEIAEQDRGLSDIIEMLQKKRTANCGRVKYFESPPKNNSTDKKYSLLPKVGKRKTDMLHDSPPSDLENSVATEQMPGGSGAIIIEAPHAPMPKKKRRKPPPGCKNILKANANGTQNRWYLQQAVIKIRKKYDLLKYNNTLIKGSKVGVNVRYAKKYDKNLESPVNNIPPSGPVNKPVFLPKTVGKYIMETEASQDPAELPILENEVDAVC